MILFERKIEQSLDVDGWPYLLQFTQKEGLQQVLFLGFWFPQLWQREVCSVYIYIYIYIYTFFKKILSFLHFSLAH